MPVKNLTYRVYLNDDDDPAGDGQIVVCRHPDLIRAEMEIGRQGAGMTSSTNPILFSTAAVWSAMVREQRTTLKFREFTDVLLDQQAVKDDVVPPTMPDPSGLLSSSPARSEAASLSGWSAPTSD